MIEALTKKGCVFGCLLPVLVATSLVACTMGYLVWLNVNRGHASLEKLTTPEAHQQARVAAALLQTDVVEDRTSGVTLQADAFTAFLEEWSRGSPVVITSTAPRPGAVEIGGALDFHESETLAPLTRLSAVDGLLGPYALELTCAVDILDGELCLLARNGTLGSQALPGWAAAVIVRLAAPDRPRPSIHPRFRSVELRKDQVVFLSAARASGK